MTMHMSGGDSGIPESYAGLEVETFEAIFNQDGASGGTGGTSYQTLDIEPLSQSGGLDHNEVAEVVGFELVTGFQMEYADADEESGLPVGAFSVRPGSLQARGLFGVNLSQAELVNGFSEEQQVNESSIQNANVSGQASLYVEEEPGILAQWVHDYTEAYFDTGEGDGTGPYAGGPASGPNTQIQKYYPQMGFRGPVIDENDDLTFTCALTDENSANAVQAEATAFTRVMYNIHEIEGVRNDFDLP